MGISWLYAVMGALADLIVMAVLKRVALVVGAAAIVAAVTLAIAAKSWEFASWVSAVIGALSVAGGLVMQARRSGNQDATTSSGDDIRITNVKARRTVIGKESSGDSSGDRIEIDSVEAGEDLYGKRTNRTWAADDQ
ncbi:hypothetical protein [Saccharopolyspora sp. NPDC050642]|uniref:hypothetical protein n=1 Tax=Saccharopolyspora sp. NPDC050642 TaxID=3157099 RepID=UPI0033D32BC8